MSTLELKNISVIVGTKTLVKGASLSLRSGEIHILMGPNGSGKSSLLNALMGHPKYPISEGQILLEGEDITSLPTEKKAKKGLFLSMQHLPEIAGVTMTNFLHRAYKELKGSTITPLEFYKHTAALAEKHGIDVGFLKKQVNSGLSGGEKKQSEVLQLLALEPSFALLDEIDSGVDVDAMKKVYEVVNALRTNGMGFFIVSHHTNILSFLDPDAVSVMRGGRIVAFGGRELAETISTNGFEKL